MPKKLPQIPAPSLLKLRKTLHRSGKVEYTLPDVLMSGLAMFGLKYPSL